MRENLFLLLNPLILQSSLLLSELRHDNLRKTKCTISSGACLLKSKWKWACPRNYLAVVSVLQDPVLTPAAARGTEGHPSWFEMKSRSTERFYCYKKKSDLSGNVSEMPHLSQEEAAEQAGHTRYVWKPHREGGAIAGSIENRSNRAATQEVQSNVKAFFFFFLKIKVILRQSLSVFHCLSQTPPRAITFGKALSVVKMFDQAFI